MLLGDHLARWSFDEATWEIRPHDPIAAELSDFDEIEEEFEEFDEEDFDDDFDDDFEEELEDEYEIEADDSMLGAGFRGAELDADDVEQADGDFADLDVADEEEEEEEGEGEGDAELTDDDDD